MDDLAREIASIRDQIDSEWNEERSARLLSGVARLQTRRRLQRLAVAGVLGAAAAVTLAVGVSEFVPRSGLGALSSRTETEAPTRIEPKLGVSQPSAEAAAGVHATTSPVEPVVRVAGGQRVRLADGSSAQMLSGSGALDVVRNETGHIELALANGLASFDVVPNDQRAFVVEAGAIEVQVVGTVFEVERSHDHVRVSVSEGKVAVRTPQGQVFVPSGQSVSFDQAGDRVAELAERAEAPARMNNTNNASAQRERSRRAVSSEASPATQSVSWRSLCQSGDYDAAYRLLEQGEVVDNEPAALMDAADAARFSGHGEASVTYLRRVLRDHRGSPVAALAGFTLGRVLLERLGQPSEAAEAFALARSLAPSGSLAQDALAREVEAWSKAGNSHEAYQRATQYVESYPNGRRLRAVQIYGGLE